MTDTNELDRVIIVGAGPSGLTLANLLGVYGIPAVVLEAGQALLNYPRAVGIDDESLRVLQAAGLVDAVLPHTGPDHILRFLGAKGQLIAELSPAGAPFGWPRRNSFIQPLIDQELLKGLERFPYITAHFGQTFTAVTQDEASVVVSTVDADGAETTWRGRYLIGADGGRSSVRKAADIAFDGITESTRWLVVDIDGDPFGTPNVSVGCDPRRPYVSVGLPHGVRRIELMMRDGENQELVDQPERLRELLETHVADADSLNVIRARVYTHHARVASQFRQGRILLAGDAAHLMPVWQGQGYNSGIRDAANLAWKLAAVLRGQSGDALLDSYGAERRPHATAMVKLSTLVGRIISPTRRSVATLRDTIFLALNAVPALKSYITEMRFKPMPRYEVGAIAHSPDLPASTTPVGRMFPQPRVLTRAGAAVRLDEVLGDWFSVVLWCNPIAHAVSQEARSRWAELGVRIVEIRPVPQLLWPAPNGDDASVVVGDVDGDVKRWFDKQPVGVVLIRPDRIVAGASLAQDAAATAAAVAQATASSSIRHAERAPGLVTGGAS